jgi:hypothetical protein
VTIRTIAHSIMLVALVEPPQCVAFIDHTVVLDEGQ